MSGQQSLTELRELRGSYERALHESSALQQNVAAMGADLRTQVSRVQGLSQQLEQSTSANANLRAVVAAMGEELRQGAAARQQQGASAQQLQMLAQDLKATEAKVSRPGLPDCTFGI